MAALSYGPGVRRDLIMGGGEGNAVQDLRSLHLPSGSVLHNGSAVQLSQKSLQHLSDNGHPAAQYVVTISGDRTLHSGGAVDDSIYQTCYGADPHSKNLTFSTISGSQMQQYMDYEQTVTSSGQYFNSDNAMLASPGTMTNNNGHLMSVGPSLPVDGHIYYMHDGTSVSNVTTNQSVARASPATVQWLLDNYETAEGVSLPRSTLYNHYLRHCAETKLEPMNPASFGKLIRSVFLGLRTRRLGTRGCSKYHYYGIALKPSSQYQGDFTSADTPLPQSASRLVISGQRNQNGSVNSTKNGAESLTVTQSHLQYLGDAFGAIPNFGHIDVMESLPEGVTYDHLRKYEHLYVQHCEAILNVVVNLQFPVVESMWKSFWNTSPSQKSGNGAVELIQNLPVSVLYAICSMPSVIKYTVSSDFAFYQALIEVLIPDVLRPIPSTLTQVIRNFAKGLENSLRSSMCGIPEVMVKAKVATVSMFSQTLRRYTSLNHLAQAARAVLQNANQVQQMLVDLNRIDFSNIQEQASWVCRCEDVVVQQLEADFKATLEQQNGLEHWAKWLETVLDRVLIPDVAGGSFTSLAQQFLLKWSFYCSMIIRDLTLRSAASFGSFHLIRLLFDEYMFYLVERKIATVNGCLPIETMSNFELLTMPSMQSGATKRSADGKPHSSNPLKSEQALSSSSGSTVLTLSTAGSSTPTFLRPVRAPIKIAVTSLAQSPGVGSKPAASEAKALHFVHANGSLSSRKIVMVPVKQGSNYAMPVEKRVN